MRKIVAFFFLFITFAGLAFGQTPIEPDASSGAMLQLATDSMTPESLENFRQEVEKSLPPEFQQDQVPSLERTSLSRFSASAAGVSGTYGYGSVNVARGKTVTPKTNSVYGAPSNIVDGNRGTVWYSYPPPSQEFVLDLGSIHTLGKIDVFVAQVYGYAVSTSIDGVAWELQARNDAFSMYAPISVAIDGRTQARFIKYYGYANWPQYVGVLEIEVYDWVEKTIATGSMGLNNLALGKPVVNLDFYGNIVPGYGEGYAVDGNFSTFTSPYQNNYNGRYYSQGLIRIDLGKIYELGKLVVKPKDIHWFSVVMTKTTNFSEFYSEPWVFQSYPNMINSSYSSSDLITFTLNGSVAARYIWVMTRTDASTVPFYSGTAEAEVYEWDPRDIRVLSLVATPSVLLIDPVTNTGSQITFHAETADETDVAFSVMQGGNQIWSSPSTVHTHLDGSKNVAEYSWDGQLGGGQTIAVGSYTVIAKNQANQKDALFEVKLKNEVLNLVSKPGFLVMGDDNEGSGIVFQAETSAPATVRFFVEQDNQSWGIGSAATQDKDGKNIAQLSWWGKLANNNFVTFGSRKIIAKIDGSQKEKDFVVFSLPIDLNGFGTWVKTKDPAAVIPPELPSIPCTTYTWCQLKTFVSGFVRDLTVDDPVNLISGNLIVPEIDLSLKSKYPLVLARIYNSLDHRHGIWGRGWSSPFTSHLEIADDQVLFINSDGSRVSFKNQNGVFTPGQGCDLKLSFTSETDLWALAHPSGETWTFDRNGKILFIAQACCGRGLSDSLEFEYLENGRLNRVKNPVGQWFEFAYSPEGRVIGVSDSAGRSIIYSYSTDGNLLSFSDQTGRTTKYEYAEEGFLTSIKRPGNRITTVVYQDRRVSEITNPSGDRTTFVTDFENHKVTLTGPNGTQHVYGFDNAWVISSYSIPSQGIYKEFTNQNGLITGIKNSLDALDTFSYTADGLYEAKTDALGNNTRFEQDPRFHKLTKKTDPLGREWKYVWCPRGNLWSEITPAGGVTSYTYDVHNNRTSKIDPLGRVSRWVYDPSGNYLVQAIDPEGGISSFSYDKRGNLLTSSDPLGRTNSFSYDLLDRLAKTVYADGRFVEIEYDEAGNVVVRRDQLGRETRYGYDLADRLVTLTRPDGTTFSYAYGPDGKKISETDPLGRVTRFEYNPIGLLTKTIWADGCFETMAYDTEGRLTSKTNELGNTTNLEYDPMGKLLATVDPSGARWESQYDTVGRKISDKDPLGRVTSYQHDNLDRITKVIRPDNSFVTSSFDAVGNLLTMVDTLGNQWCFVYDGLNRQVKAIQPNGASSTTKFDAAGQVVAETDALGRITEHTFDNGGRRTAIKDALGNIWQNAYDGAGRLIAVKDPLGAVSSLSYDIMDRMVSQADALGNVTSFEFDAAGRRVAKTDAMGRRSITAYDQRDRVISEVDPEGHTVAYGYNLAGQRVSLTDGTNRTWRWDFDNLGRVTAEYDPLGNVNRYAFDSAGNRTSWTNARGQTTTYLLDLMNRISQISYSDGTIATLAYDLEGRELVRSGPAGSVSKTWDSVGNMTSETFGPWGKKWQYSFDLAGNRVQAIDPEGQVFKYRWDALNRVIELDPPEKGDEIKYSFDAAGRLVTEERPGAKTTNTFDLAGHLLTLSHIRNNGAAKVIASRQYQYNQVGDKISEKNENNEVTFYNYSGADWLTQTRYPDGQIVSYVYNGAGDRLEEKVETPTVKKDGKNAVIGTDTVVIPMVYDAGGRLVSRASDTFVFDNDGNQVSAVEGGDETRLSWSPDNRLLNVERDLSCTKHNEKKCKKCNQPLITYETYTYEPGTWRRLMRTNDGAQFASVFQQDDEALEYQVKNYLAKKDHDADCKCSTWQKPHLQVIRQFIGGPGTDDLAVIKYHGRTLEMLKDGLGSTIALTNRGGHAVSRMSYDAWGNQKVLDKPGYGVPPCKESDLDSVLDRLEGKYTFGEPDHDGWWYGRHFSKTLSPYLFTSRRLDSFTGNYNHRNRQYNPKYGRWISRDMLGFGGGLNLWGYANGNPLRFTDPFGQTIAQAAEKMWAAARDSFGSSPQSAIYQDLAIDLAHYSSPDQNDIVALGIVSQIVRKIYYTLLPQAPSECVRGHLVGAIHGIMCGQSHHAITKKIYRRGIRGTSLSGSFSSRDPNYVAKAIENAHVGYAQWHRDLDDDIIKHLTDPDIANKITPLAFRIFLEERYSRADLIARFPFGFQEFPYWPYAPDNDDEAGAQYNNGD